MFTRLSSKIFFNGKKKFLLENRYIVFPNEIFKKNYKIENFYLTHGKIRSENIPLCYDVYISI